LVLRGSGSHKTNGSERTINTLEAHSCFGEIAVLDGLPRSAMIRDTKETVVLRVPLEKFKALIDDEPYSRVQAHQTYGSNACKSAADQH